MITAPVITVSGALVGPARTALAHGLRSTFAAEHRPSPGCVPSHTGLR